MTAHTAPVSDVRQSVSDVRQSVKSDSTHAFQKNGLDLYAVPIVLMNPKTGQPVPGSGRIHHIHADSSSQALLHFKTIYPNRRTHHIVGASVCIGHYVENKKGTIVSAT